jgi:hypothetical protein
MGADGIGQDGHWLWRFVRDRCRITDHLENQRPRHPSTAPWLGPRSGPAFWLDDKSSNRVQVGLQPSHQGDPVDSSGTGDREREMGLLILIILLVLLFGGGGYGYSRYGYGGGIGIGGILLIVLIVYLLFGYSRF